MGGVCGKRESIQGGWARVALATARNYEWVLVGWSVRFRLWCLRAKGGSVRVEGGRGPPHLPDGADSIRGERVDVEEAQLTATARCVCLY